MKPVQKASNNTEARGFGPVSARGLAESYHHELASPQSVFYFRTRHFHLLIFDVLDQNREFFLHDTVLPFVA